jgi:hypothetical protein
MGAVSHKSRGPRACGDVAAETAPALARSVFMIEQLDRTRSRLLSQARRLEEAAKRAGSESEQDRILDATVWLRLVASLPRYNAKPH